MSNIKLKIAERDSESLFVYGSMEDVLVAMNIFEPVVMTTSYGDYPAIVVKKSTEEVN